MTANTERQKISMEHKENKVKVRFKMVSLAG